MRLGEDGFAWFEEVYALSGDNDNKLTDWQKEFIQNYNVKVEQYCDQCFISEKQMEQLNKIAENLGVTLLTEADLD